MKPRSFLLAAIGLLAGLTILLFGLFSHSVVIMDGRDVFAYPLPSLLAVVLGAMLFAGSLVMLLSGPLYSEIYRSEPVNGGKGKATKDLISVQGGTGSGVEKSPDHEVTAHLDVDLVLRLLDGNERIVFKTLADSDGTAFQKDIVNRTKMSDATVSRVIDHLEAMRLVSRERQGMSNRIMIVGF